MKELFDIENIREKIMSDSAKICGITSVRKGEGKTYISTLLQESMHQIGDKTLLISVDGNWETNKTLYKDEAVLCIEDLKDFKVNGLESDKVHTIAFSNLVGLDQFIYSEDYKALLEECKEKYSHILIDMMALSEKSISKKICELCDETLIIVSKDTENGLDVKKEVDQLRSMGVEVKGIILNEYSFKKKIFRM